MFGLQDDVIGIYIYIVCLKTIVLYFSTEYLED